MDLRGLFSNPRLFEKLAEIARGPQGDCLIGTHSQTAAEPPSAYILVAGDVVAGLDQTGAVAMLIGSPAAWRGSQP